MAVYGITPARGEEHRNCSLVFNQEGITPACAGKRLIATVAAAVIGESPPHARGRE